VTRARLSVEEDALGLERNHAGDCPQVSPKAYVHPTAVLIGNVQVGDDVFVGPCAVLRADEPGPEGTVVPVVVGPGANVQDGVIIHALGGTGVSIGAGTSVAHAAVIHGPCGIGEDCFVGFGSVVFGSDLGRGVAVMHRCLVEAVVVPAGRLVPSGAVVRGPDDVQVLTETDADTRSFMERVRRTNVELAKAQLGG
jgi:carbonic anhydrase/acetyltransferase-like protein (isoleucine patch superfamily)